MHIHFVGIGGSGISGVAKLATKMGYQVTGCDLEKNTAYVKNVFQGHDVSHIKNTDMVVVSPAVFFQDKKIAEIELAKKEGKLITWQELLGKHLLKNKKLICIAGTHGKSTTTAMAGKLLVENGFDPIVVLGAAVPEWDGNSRFGEGEYAVVEADEFNNNFLNYKPDIAIINNIEFDHPDFFKNEEDVKKSFEDFKKNLVGDKTLITKKDSLNKKFNLKIPGVHNQENANMVFLLGIKLGISQENVIKSIESFKGISRRLELIGEENGIKIYDDYAHHPTAIAATLEGLREIYPDNKIWTIVEPHGFSRTHSLLGSYKGVFDQADNVIIGPIFKARDTETFGVTPDTVAGASEHKEIVGTDSLDKIKEIVAREANSGDVIIVMGAGKSYLWAREILQMLGDGNKTIKVFENKSFKELTTFQIGGSIKYYVEARSKKEVEEAVGFAKKKDLPIFVIGGGSDVLVSDKDFEGLAIKYIGDGVEIKGNIVTSQAGKNWDELVADTIDANLQGIECLSGIPGSVGGAPIQNIGAYGQEIKNVFVSLTAFDIKNEKFVEFNNRDCEFGYRESIFKKPDHWQKYVITDVTLKLKERVEPEVKYDSLKNYLLEKGITKPTLMEVREAVVFIRSGKFENPKEVGNAGSFFKNPTIDSDQAKKLMDQYPNIPMRDQENGKFKGYAAWLIEEAGWKGKVYKNAGVSPKHALVLINPEGKASAQDIIELSDMIIKDVDEKFGVKLEREVQLINL